ncbi:MAG TPA: hypothetical protein VFM51_06425 [Solirubrobacterales bacterium]|nr:hypothetical protein [Solirubrobacterales bacterium]
MRAWIGKAEVAAARLTATPVLLATMAIAGAWIVVLGQRLSFLLDDWGYILFRDRGDLDNWMRPDNEHFVAGPVTVWKLLIGTFGIDSMLPFKLVSTALFLLGVWFLFVWVRRRIGEWPALLAMIPLLFCGAAFDDLLWFASITFLGSMAGGLGMLVALDRRDSRGDRLACLGLTVSLLFSSLWVAFAAGAALDILLRRERPWLGRAFIVAVPALIYVAWWVGWGHEAESALSLQNVVETPFWIFDSIAAAIAALLGLAVPAEGIRSPNGLDWGRPLAAIFVPLALWRLWKMPRVPRSLWVVLAVAFAYWTLGGFDVKPGRDASASRYQYTGGAFVLLIGAGLLSGVRFRRRHLIPAVAVVAAAVLPNVVFFHEASEAYRRVSQIERADLAALEIARPRIQPGYRIEEQDADTGYVPVEAVEYFEARDAHGSPAYTEGELVEAPEHARVPGDKVLAAALGLELGELSRPIGRCHNEPIEEGKLRLPLLRGGVALRTSAPVHLALGRFSYSFPVDLGEVSPDAWVELRIPTDLSPRPWQLRATGSGRLALCRLSQR